MEYTFKNRWAEKASTVTLSNTFLELLSAGTEPEVISYSTVKSIRLFRVSARHYRLYLYSGNRKPIVISNRYCLSSTETEDRSRQYVTFVRVLHLHLKNENETIYKTGFSIAALAWRVCFAVTASAILALLSHTITPGIINPFAVGLGFLLFLLLLIFIVERNRMPHAYQAAEIPLDFLP